MESWKIWRIFNLFSCCWHRIRFWQKQILFSTFYNIELQMWFSKKHGLTLFCPLSQRRLQRCHFVPSMKRLLIWPMIQHRIQGKDTVVQTQKSVTKECTWLCWTNSSIKSQHALQTLRTRVFLQLLKSASFQEMSVGYLSNWGIWLLVEGIWPVV